jgi:multimeric flavodoxin WrbA
MNGYSAPTSPAAGGKHVTNGSNMPTDWWQRTAKTNGYDWDAIANGYKKDPAYAGKQAADYANAAMGGMTGSMKSLMDQFGGGAGGVGGGATGVGGVGGVGGGTGGGGNPAIPPIAAPDMTQANAAVFSKAKDRAGALARASLNSLNGELGANGGGSMIGSGAQVQGTRDVIEKGAGMLEDTNNQMAMSDAALKADFAKLGYQGSITQRGQDIQQQEANAQLALAQQDRYMKQLQMLMQMFGTFGGGGKGGGYGGGVEIL